jgi:hypothetical protein
MGSYGHNFEIKENGPADTLLVEPTAADHLNVYALPLAQPAQSETTQPLETPLSRSVSPTSESGCSPVGAESRRETCAAIYTRGWVRPAPTVGEILADPANLANRERESFFAHRNPDQYGAAENKSLTSRDGQTIVPADDHDCSVLEDFSEATALADLHHKMLAAKKLLYLYLSEGSVDESKVETIQHAIAAAQSLSSELRFIGRQELEEASLGLAGYWYERLRAGKELFLAYNPQESSGYISALILDKLRSVYDPYGCYDKSIHWLDTSVALSAEIKSRLQHSGVIFPDDWVLSGSDMRREISKFMSKNQLPANCAEINYICATDKYIASGLADVPVRAYFIRPHTENDQSSTQASVVGSHCAPDDGFRVLIYQIYHTVKHAALSLGFDSYARLPQPILSAPAKPYRPLLHSNAQLWSRQCATGTTVRAMAAPATGPARV